MGNCLVTKLKGVVDNPNLDKLGYCRITKKVSIGNGDFVIGPSNSQAALTIDFIIENGSYYAGDMTVGSYETLTVGSYRRTYPAGHYFIISPLSLGSSVSVNLLISREKHAEINSGNEMGMELKYILGYVDMYQIKEYTFYPGNPKISDYVKFCREKNVYNKVTYINLYNTNIDPDLTDAEVIDFCGRLVIAHTLQLMNTTASVEAIAQGQVANGRTSGQLIYYPGEDPEYKITFDSSLPNGYSITQD